MAEKMKMWVVTAKFPNINQPWLSTAIAQIPKQGMSLKIFSTNRGDHNYTKIVDDYNLLEKTEILEASGLKSLKKLFINFVSPKYFFRSIRGLFNSQTLGSKHKGMFSNLLTRLILAPYLIKGDVDIIHCHSEPAGHKLLPLIKSQGVPFVITFHGLQPLGVNRLPVNMRVEYTEHAAVILVNTEFAKRSYAKLGADITKIKVIPQGLDTNQFAYMPKLFPEDGVVKILTVGRFNQEKGQKYAIEAIAQLISKGRKIDYTLIGQGPDKEQIRQLVHHLEIQQHVHFLPVMSGDKIIAEYQKAHILILPSLKAESGFLEETQGVVIQEAQACGTLVVATETGGIPECVEDGQTAFLVKDRSASAIADMVIKVIDNSREWPRWQKNARRSVEQNYDIDVIGKKISTLYHQLKK